MCKVLIAIYYFDVSFLGEQPQIPLNATAICAEVHTNVHSVPMLCLSLFIFFFLKGETKGL